jgi:KDO2-lipid IV(A) lauroyltransferase
MESGAISRNLSAGIVAAVLRVLGFRQRVVERNLALTGLRPVRDFYPRLCRAAANDFAVLAWARPPGISQHVRAPSRLAAMRSGSSILLTAHFHNWEVLGRELRRRGVPLLAAAKPLRNARAEALLRSMRAGWGVATLSASVPRAALRHLKGKGCFALLWDQHAPGSAFADRFFGRPVLLNPLPFFLLRHHPCPVYFGVMVPGGVLRVLRLLAWPRGDWEKKLMRRYHRVLEILVRRHPEYWYGFFHARFKNGSDYPGHRAHRPGALPHPGAPKGTPRPSGVAPQVWE